MDLLTILETIEHSGIYLVVLVFFAWYPIFSSLMWILTSLIYFVRRERRQGEEFYALDEYPPVTILIPAYNEERNIEATLRNATQVDYPNYEIVVVDDASTDRTAEMVMRYVDRGGVRLIRKMTNQGKAMALNDAIPCTNGEILLVIDADASPDPDILRYIVPHFRFPRVAAVTGNPRVANRKSFLGKLQAIEFLDHQPAEARTACMGTHHDDVGSRRGVPSVCADRRRTIQSRDGDRGYRSDMETPSETL